MTQEEIEKMIAVIHALVEKYVVSNRKYAVIKFLEEKGDLIFTAPASSKNEYHSSFPGGLIKHSINVFKNLKSLNETFKCNFNEESMFICALFHDIGKSMCSDLNNPHYIDADDWQKNKLGQNYKYNESCIFMTTHLRSMFILQSFGINLSAEEYMAIYLNDGMYLKENASYGMKEPKLALMVHMADRIACEQEKT